MEGRGGCPEAMRENSLFEASGPRETGWLRTKWSSHGAWKLSKDFTGARWTEWAIGFPARTITDAIRYAAFFTSMIRCAIDCGVLRLGKLA